MSQATVATKKYIEFLYPGFIFAETVSAPYKKGAAIPKGAYAYRLFTRKEVVDSGDLMLGAVTYLPGKFYAPGSVVTLAKDIEKKFPGEQNRILRNSVTMNRFPAVVKTPIGNCTEFDPKTDKVLKINAVL